MIMLAREYTDVPYCNICKAVKVWNGEKWICLFASH